jgi:hypothetical protein
MLSCAQMAWSARLSAVPFAALVAFCFAAEGPPQGSPDPVVASLPFEDWFKQTDQTHLRWTLEVVEPVLSTHQRLVSRIRVKIDGDELVRRKGKGQFLVLVQIADESGGVWQTHNEIDLEHLPESMRANDIEYLVPFFLLPGQYTLSVAAYDTATGEHMAARRKLHAAPLKNDPLPNAWQGLPAIEFVPAAQPPDTWFLPSIETRLHLPAATKKKTRIDILLNLTPSERLSGSTAIQNRQMASLLPAFKAITQVEWSGAEVNAAFLDLSQRKVVFEQKNLKTVEWDRAAGTLAERAPGIVDIKALENRKFSADFFVKQVSRRVSERDDSPHAVIVLTSPVTFDPGVNLNPIEAAPREDLKVFYIRYQSLPPAVLFRNRGPGGGIGIRGSLGPQSDQIEPLLKGLAPHLFDVSNPTQLRKALAAMINEIGAM